MAHTFSGLRGSTHSRFPESDVRFRRFFDDEPGSGATGECVPPMDVLETAEAVILVMDLPGVAPASLRVAFTQGTMIVAGRKLPAVCAHREAAFHLAERSFGRFARAIRVAGAYDAGRATATLTDGELRIVVPRIEERRGREIRIDVSRS